MSGITAWHSGVPFSLGEGDQADLGNSFDTQRPNYTPNAPGCNNNVYGNQSPNQWFNEKCFQASQYGTVGNLGRNVMKGPGYADTDIGITKNTRINERLSLQFKAELFNIFNHPNFAPPGGSIINAGQATVGPSTSYDTAGAQITSLVGSGGIAGVARQTQFSLKLIF